MISRYAYQNHIKQGDLGQSRDPITHAIASLREQEPPLEMRKTACLQYISSGDR